MGGQTINDVGRPFCHDLFVHFMWEPRVAKYAARAQKCANMGRCGDDRSATMLLLHIMREPRVANYNGVVRVARNPGRTLNGRLADDHSAIIVSIEFVCEPHAAIGTHHRTIVFGKARACQNTSQLGSNKFRQSDHHGMDVGMSKPNSSTNQTTAFPAKNSRDQLNNTCDAKTVGKPSGTMFAIRCGTKRQTHEHLNAGKKFPAFWQNCGETKCTLQRRNRCEWCCNWFCEFGIRVLRVHSARSPQNLNRMVRNNCLLHPHAAAGDVTYCRGSAVGVGNARGEMWTTNLHRNCPCNACANRAWQLTMV